MPWALRAFQAEVPGEWFALDGDVAVIACPCKVDPPPAARFNVVTRCAGEGCGRWFFFNGSRVLVAKEPDDYVPEDPGSGSSSGP